MSKYKFHAILEYGLGDYDDTEYELEVSEEELAILKDAAERKVYFDEDEACRDIYQWAFQILFEKEKKRYLDAIYENAECDPVEGEDYDPFEAHAFYLTL